MTTQITKIQALLMYDSKWWEAMDDIQVARFQLSQAILAMPFAEFHGIASEHGMSLLAHSARHKALADAVAEAGVALARAVDRRAGRTS